MSAQSRDLRDPIRTTVLLSVVLYSGNMFLTTTLDCGTTRPCVNDRRSNCCDRKLPVILALARQSISRKCAAATSLACLLIRKLSLLRRAGEIPGLGMGDPLGIDGI